MLTHDPNQLIDGNNSDMTGRVMIVLGGNAFVKPGEQLTMAGQFQFTWLVPARLEPLLAEPARENSNASNVAIPNRFAR